MIHRLILATAFAAFLHVQPAHAQKASSGAVPTADEAPIALLIDVTSGQVLFARNENRRFVPASITKTMTVFVAFERISNGTLDPASTIIVPEAVSTEWFGKGSSMLLPPQAEVRVSELLTGIATVSANDGSIVLASGLAGSVPAWLDEMNNAARRLGMVNSHFGTPNGWPDDGRTFTTANDLFLLAKAMIERHPKLYAEYIGQPSFAYNGITQVNRDPILGRIAGADGIKTGFTSEAGFGFLGSAKQNGQRLVMVLGGVDRNALRAKLAREFMRWGFEAFERKRLLQKSVIVGSARVQGGDARSVNLITDRQVYVNIPREAEDGVSYSVIYDGPLRAPINAGEPIGKLRISVPGMKPALVPLLAEQSVETAGFFRTIYNGVTGWFE
ncbi:D-alanyl-D-alanine carboxypeptidase [Erythrobacter insulae]|uniref:serine-type D-Ala-D-Ala carboxypeptidase n=1 Tax=Erythrobacter insulae TaxID=2584124 RepID=A0A547PFF4_9SPHN|nr:D-alanyl-D-alanine carboxypeptidase [Erythrobacter insulae]